MQDCTDPDTVLDFAQNMSKVFYIALIYGASQLFLKMIPNYFNCDLLKVADKYTEKVTKASFVPKTWKKEVLVKMQKNKMLINTMFSFLVFIIPDKSFKESSLTYGKTVPYPA